MKIVYKSDDGAEFETEEECVFYETENKLAMWDLYGESTDNIREAVYIHIPNENFSKVFLKLCSPQHNTCETYKGIQEGNYGFFVWNEYENSYKRIDPNTLRLLWKFMRKHPEEFKE